MKKRIAIIGTGAVGALYGSILAKNDHELFFLARSDYKHIAQNGLKIKSRYGDIRVDKVNVYQKLEDLPSCDLAILSTKTTANSGLLLELSENARKFENIMILQNGIGFEEKLGQYVEAQKIIGATCFICSSKIGPGYIHHQDYGSIKLAPFAESSALASQMWKKLFEEAGLEVIYSENLKKERWKKLFWNIPFNGLSVVLNSTTQPLVSQKHTSALILDLMEEVRQMAFACGVEVKQSFIEKMFVDTQKMTDYKPSMYLDYINQRELELEYLYDIPLEMAKEKKCEAPKVRALAQQLHFINEKLAWQNQP